MTDYYSILGLSRSASSDEIKSAYKKLALKNHPDRGGNKDTFQKIQEAYEVLSDDTRKSEYDNPGNNFFNNDPFFNHFGNNFGNNFGNHFNQSSKTNPPVKKSDYHYSCNITLEDVFTGCVKKLKVQRKYGCKTCFNRCGVCSGSGKTTRSIQLGPFRQIVEQACGNCSASGKVFIKVSSCTKCDESGVIKEDEIFEICIKKAVESGKTYIFKDWGEQPIKDNEIPGSFIVTINVLKHKHFERSGLHLIYKVKLTLRESIVGKEIQIPHFSEPILLNTGGFGIINPSKEYIVFNKGLTNETKNGDLRIRFDIDYIDKSFSLDELTLLNETFDKIHFK